MVPGLLLAAGAFFCPESPRWLAKRGQWEAAEAKLVGLRQLPSTSDYVVTEMFEIREQLNRENAIMGVNVTAMQRFRELFLKGNWNRLLIGVTLMMCQNMTGVNVSPQMSFLASNLTTLSSISQIITYYSPRIFETLGITGTNTKLFATGFYGVAKTIGMVIFSLWLVERIGRRKGLIYGAFIGSLPVSDLLCSRTRWCLFLVPLPQMWYIGGYVMVADPARKAAAGEYSRSGAGYFAMVCVYLYGLIYCATWQGMSNSYGPYEVSAYSLFQVLLGFTAPKSSHLASVCSVLQSLRLINGCGHSSSPELHHT